MKYIVLLALSFLLCAPAAIAQEPADPVSDKGYYRSDVMGGLFIHTNGFGASFRRGWRVTGFVNRYLSIDLLSMKHPKEYKTPSIGGNSGYYLGKLNSLTVLRPTFGWSKALYDKEVKRGVRVGYVFLFGPSLGITKPTYLEISHEDLGPESIERYDPAKHDAEHIKGRAPWSVGLDKLDIYPGLSTRFGFTFEFSPTDELVRTLEAGAAIDVYGKEIPIMANTYNNQFFLTLYAGIYLGKRYL